MVVTGADFAHAIESMNEVWLGCETAENFNFSTQSQPEIYV